MPGRVRPYKLIHKLRLCLSRKHTRKSFHIKKKRKEKEEKKFSNEKESKKYSQNIRLIVLLSKR